MNGDRSRTYPKRKLLAIVAILTVGSTAFAGTLSLPRVAGALSVVGFLLVIPLIAVLGEDFPFVEAGSESDAGEEASTDAVDPVDRLRDRYARGELSDAEFERRLDRLVETEDLDATRSDDLVELE